jgi:hypothetical protein
MLSRRCSGGLWRALGTTFGAAKRPPRIGGLIIIARADLGRSRIAWLIAYALLGLVRWIRAGFKPLRSRGVGFAWRAPLRRINEAQEHLSRRRGVSSGGDGFLSCYFIKSPELSWRIGKQVPQASWPPTDLKGLPHWPARSRQRGIERERIHRVQAGRFVRIRQRSLNFEFVHIWLCSLRFSQ